MSRYSNQSSYGHRIRWHFGAWEISWTVDRYVSGSRLRFPTTYTRATGDAGARRFCAKWDIELPERLR